MADFAWDADYNASKKASPKVKVVQFGDGYEQRQAFGLNSNLKVWTLTFNQRSESEGDAIDAFLEDKGGVTAFEWTPPGESESVFVCREWTLTIVHGNLYNITAVFHEVAEP